MRQALLRLALLLIFAGGLLSICGCSHDVTSAAISYSQEGEIARAELPLRQVPGPYALRTNDQLHVQVYNEPTITGDYVVDSTGYLSIPIAGRVKAAGLTAAQLEHRLTAKLNGGILKDARVNVQITNYAPFYILGEVKKPGEFPYRPGLTVGDAVALAGGYTYRADEDKVYVRPAGAVAEIERSLNADPSVSPGDNIRIPERFL
jgi:polysaccharide export outer membrane protein